VNWKTDLKLTDLNATTAIEIVCKRCGVVRYETQAQLLAQFDFQHAIWMRLNTACIVQTASAMVECAFRSLTMISTRASSGAWRELHMATTNERSIKYPGVANA
jgi:hypothetical protein